MRPVCGRLGHSRQSFYKDRKARRRKVVDEEFIIDAVARERAVHPRCGTRKLLKYTRETLLRAGVTIGRDRLFELLRAHGMLVERRKASAPRTTRFDESLPLSHNLVTGRVFDAPNQVFVVGMGAKLERKRNFENGILACTPAAGRLQVGQSMPRMVPFSPWSM